VLALSQEKIVLLFGCGGECEWWTKLVVVGDEEEEGGERIKNVALSVFPSCLPTSPTILANAAKTMAIFTWNTAETFLLQTTQHHSRLA
jgi:hypothetical protein